MKMIIPTQMQKNSHPLDSIIDFAWAAGADLFWINNAKDELKRLKEKTALVNTPESDYYEVAAWARINDKGQLFDLRLQKNPHINPETIIPLYIKLDYVR